MSPPSTRDFSLFSLFTAGLACLVPFTAAYTKPTGDAPEGNAIYQPGLNSVVPAGENFTVTWDPTTKGTITLVLLKGPSTNAVPQYAIAEHLPNSGSYTWSPSLSLAPGTTGYGLQLIVDATGQYQYSTQFGISNDAYVAPSSSSASLTTSTATSSSKPTHPTGPPAGMTWASTWAMPGGGPPPAGYTWTTSTGTAAASTVSARVTGGAKANTTTTTIAVIGNGTSVSVAYGTGVPSSGYPAGNSSLILPTGSVTVPVSLRTSATLTASSVLASATGAASASPSATNGAAGVASSFVGLVVAGAVAVWIL